MERLYCLQPDAHRPPLVLFPFLFLSVCLSALQTMLEKSESRSRVPHSRTRVTVTDVCGVGGGVYPEACCGQPQGGSTALRGAPEGPPGCDALGSRRIRVLDLLSGRLGEHLQPVNFFPCWSC